MVLRLPFLIRGPLSRKADVKRQPWNAGRSVGQKFPLTANQVGRIRQRLVETGSLRDLALFTTAIDSMLRASDLLALRVGDVFDSTGAVRSTVSIRQSKTGHPVKVVLMPETQAILGRWVGNSLTRKASQPLFPGRSPMEPLSRRHYQRLVKSWIAKIAACPADYGTHSIRRTKASIIYAETRNIEAVRILLGQKSIASTTYYLGVTESAALKLASSTSL